MSAGIELVPIGSLDDFAFAHNDLKEIIEDNQPDLSKRPTKYTFTPVMEAYNFVPVDQKLTFYIIFTFLILND